MTTTTDIRDALTESFENPSLSFGNQLWYDAAGLNIGFGYNLSSQIGEDGSGSAATRDELSAVGLTFTNTQWDSIVAEAEDPSATSGQATNLNSSLGGAATITLTQATSLMDNFYTNHVTSSTSSLSTTLSGDGLSLSGLPTGVQVGLEDLLYNAPGALSEIPNLSTAIASQDWGAAAYAIEFNPNISDTDTGRINRRIAEAMYILGFSPTIDSSHHVTALDPLNGLYADDPAVVEFEQLIIQNGNDTDTVKWPSGLGGAIDEYLLEEGYVVPKSGADTWDDMATLATTFFSGESIITAAQLEQYNGVLPDSSISDGGLVYIPQSTGTGFSGEPSVAKVIEALLPGGLVTGKAYVVEYFPPQPGNSESPPFPGGGIAYAFATSPDGANANGLYVFTHNDDDSVTETSLLSSGNGDNTSVTSDTTTATITVGNGNNDALDASSSTDSTLVAGNGNNNTLTAGSGTTTMINGNGTGGVLDAAATTGAATLIGGDGGNTFYLGSGTDTVTGGAGDDTYVFGSNSGANPGTGTTVTDNGGNNTVVADSSDISGASVSGVQTLQDDVNNLKLTNNEFTGFDNIINDPVDGNLWAADAGTYDLSTKTVTGDFNLDGSHTSDDVTLIGNNQAGQVLTGGSGNDTLQAGSGADDVLTAGSGDTTLIAGASSDTMTGGNGDDTFGLTSTTAGATIDGGDGDNTIALSGGGTIALSIDNISDIEEMTLASSTTAYNLSIDNFNYVNTTDNSNTADTLTFTGGYNNNITVNGITGLTVSDDGTNDYLTINDGAGGVTATLNGDYAQAFDNAAGDNVTVTGLNGGINSSEDDAAATFSGDQEWDNATGNNATFNDTSAGTNGWIWAAGTNNTADVYGVGTQANMEGANSTVNLYGDSTIAVLDATDGTATASGTGDYITDNAANAVTTITGDDGEVDIWASGSTATISGYNSGVQLNADDTSATLSGTEDWETASGNNVTITDTGANTWIGSDGNDAEFTVNANSVHVSFTGTGDSVSLTGTTENVSATNSSIALGASTGVTVSGNGNTISFASSTNDTASVSGAGSVYQFGSSFGQDTITNSTGGSASGEIEFTSGSTTGEDLWFQHTGNNLVIDLLGTSDSITISNWYSGASHQAASFAADGKTLDSQIASLVSAMASFAASNPSFNPTTATSMPTDMTLQNAIASAWHS